jgi:hypothetical protein
MHSKLPMMSHHTLIISLRGNTRELCRHSRPCSMEALYLYSSLLELWGSCGSPTLGATRTKTQPGVVHVCLCAQAYARPIAHMHVFFLMMAHFETKARVFDCKWAVSLAHMRMRVHTHYTIHACLYIASDTLLA